MYSLQSHYSEIKNSKSLWVILALTLSLLILIAINIDDISDVNTIFLIFRIFAIVVVLGMVTYTYAKHKNLILIYLIVSISSLLASELFITIFQTDTFDEFSQILVSVAVSSILLMISLFFFLLFFESFNSEHIMTKQNLFLLTNLLILSTGLFLTSSFTISKLSDTIGSTDSVQTGQGSQNVSANPESSSSFIDDSIYIFVILAIVLIVYLVLHGFFCLSTTRAWSAEPNIQNLFSDVA